MRESVSAGERLTLTLRYLATGETQVSLACQFRISHNLISAIIPEVCRAIYQVLKDEYVKLPSTEEEWRAIAHGYFAEWNYPLCLGALDGKRILICKPPNSGSDYYDYKGHFSLIMMALVDASYKFMYVDVGAIGRSSDGGVWDKCTLKEGIETKLLNIPEPEEIPFTRKKIPYTIVGDDAFPLKTYLMKPFPGRDQTAEKRIFNYRLSRARRTSENAFGILAARFQVFKNPIRTSPTNVKDISFAAVALHNFLREHSKDTYSPPELIDREDEANGRMHQGQWHQHQHHAFEGLHAMGRGHSNDAKNIRASLCDYFNNEGRVAWQDQMALLH
ncbi:hypothetical protein Pmani_003581 [Petrolisthes manimaculis]|uniref:DDE Tnp4 domain-containing protein n=2 Tax=Petrolisthes manimaculis TaxID=1843537 RepID=A0AAE1UJC8_9EUCA|nr:hypothetical protein Pmani_003581 [Petrolisthes manimaculis]